MSTINTITYTPLKNSILASGEVVSPSVSKETEPVGGFSQGVTYQEAGELQVSPDASAYINKHEEVIKVGEDLEKLGISPIQTTNFPSYNEVTLPISDEKIEEGLKKPVSSSFRWLAELAHSIFLRKSRLA